MYSALTSVQISIDLSSVEATVILLQVLQLQREGLIIKLHSVFMSEYFNSFSQRYVFYYCFLTIVPRDVIYTLLLQLLVS